MPGDVDAYTEAIVLGAREHIEWRRCCRAAASGGPPEEALAWVEKDRRGRGGYDLTLASLRVIAFDALGRPSKAQALRWHFRENAQCHAVARPRSLI
jgi:hypothetical protein